MKNLLMLFFCFTTTLFAQSAYNTHKIGQTKAESIFLSYEKAPSKVFVGELFAVKLKAIIANSDFEKIVTSFQDLHNAEILNPDANWQRSSRNIFYNTFYFKANDTTAKLPSLSLSIHQNSYKIDSSTIEAITPSIIKLNKTKEFSGVIAEEFNVKKSRTTYFDDKNYIIVLEIEAKMANLNDFSLGWVIRDGIDSSNFDLPYVHIFYYAIIPSSTRELNFTYFDTTTNAFQKISLPIEVDEKKMSTHTDLNPAQSSLQIYKDMAYGVVALVLIALFARRRKAGYIIFLAILIGLFIYNKNPFNSIKIDKGSKVKILPTQGSTVFYITNRTLYGQKLGSRDEYIKVLLPDGKIGWIDDSKN